MLAPDTKPVVDFFTGTFFSVREIESALDHLKFHIRDLAAAHDGKRAVSMNCAAEDTARVARQIATLSDHLVKMTIQHVNRRPRA